jgi:putative spermidine/putrescine transport system permease protein
MPLALAVLAALFLIVPILIVVPMSFSNAVSFEFPPPSWGLKYYGNYFSNPDWLEPTFNSFAIACGTMVLTLLLAVPASLAFARLKFRGKMAVNLLIMSPMIVPQVVSAVGYYGYLSLFNLTGTRLGVLLAHTALALPVAFLVISATMKGFDQNLERAAMNLGANPLRTFFHVTIPVLRPGIAVGALFAFLSSFNEAVVAIFIAGRDSSTLPKKMFESIRLESDPTIAVVSTLLTGAALAGVLIAFIPRKRTAL